MERFSLNCRTGNYPANQPQPQCEMPPLKGLGVAPAAVSLLLLGRRNVPAEVALRLARYVGTTAEFWIGLQGQYDLDVAQDEPEGRIAREVRRCPLLPAAA